MELCNIWSYEAGVKKDLGLWRMWNYCDVKDLNRYGLESYKYGEFELTEDLDLWTYGIAKDLELWS